MSIDQQIRRIQQQVSDRCIAVYPVLTATDVVAFEEEHGISLPDGYRRFILEIGNGGRGPEDIFKLDSYARQDWAQLPRAMIDLPDICEPFPYTERWIWEDEDWENGELQDAKADIYDGNICIGYGGCDLYYHLIVTGPERGNVWNFTGVGIGPVADDARFLEWYEQWLNSEDSRYHDPSLAGTSVTHPWWKFW